MGKKSVLTGAMIIAAGLVTAEQAAEASLANDQDIRLNDVVVPESERTTGEYFLAQTVCGGTDCPWDKQLNRRTTRSGSGQFETVTAGRPGAGNVRRQRGLTIDAERPGRFDTVSPLRPGSRTNR